MKLDDLTQNELYGDLNMTIKQSINLVKEDKLTPVPGGPVSKGPSGPAWLEGLKTLCLLLLLLVVCLALLSPQDVRLWVAAGLLLVSALGLHQHQKALSLKYPST